VSPQEPERKFGETIRAAREQKEIGLRRFADLIGISPTYLSKVERGEFAPPAEDKIIAIARELGLDQDEMLALAGKVATDLSEIIQEHPREMASFLRTARDLSPEDLRRLTQEIQERKKLP
jgi:HTH-type transcriptional regulator, competence development regulator